MKELSEYDNAVTAQLEDFPVDNDNAVCYMRHSNSTSQLSVFFRADAYSLTRMLLAALLIEEEDQQIGIRWALMNALLNYYEGDTEGAQVLIKNLQIAAKKPRRK